jgi:hypothetical protein
MEAKETFKGLEKPAIDRDSRVNVFGTKVEVSQVTRCT